jgi:osmotically-inducible protein OsmY
MCYPDSVGRRHRVTRAKAFVVGMGVAYFLDPERGRRRRHELRDRGARLARQTRRATTRKTKFLYGRVLGVEAQVRRVLVHPDVPIDDRTVEQRIRSDAFREAGVTAKDVDVSVEHGVATLRGAVSEPSTADAVIARVRRVPGVVDVAAMLRVGVPAQAQRAG